MTTNTGTWSSSTVPTNATPAGADLTITEGTVYDSEVEARITFKATTNTEVSVSIADAT